ncbi:MAG: hypothetical protein M1550_01680 [Deltaproteobacteria bacterium]|nr:hypothetical protein [Deltaproteobacteria bacterium]
MSMNLESRELLRVEVGDETDADEIFAKHVSDPVELRRKFIEKNVPDVMSLDIRGARVVGSRMS